MNSIIYFDGINFYETLTPAKAGKIAGAAYRQWDGNLFQDYLKRFQLPADQEIRALSRGMKMKLGIAVALSHKPRLLILDEATSGLDPVMRDDILDVFLDFVQDENHSILMSSHITTDLEKIADYITFIHQGRVLFSKTKDELRYSYGIIHCGAALFDQLDKDDILAFRKDDYQWNVLVIFCTIGSLFGVIGAVAGGLITGETAFDLAGIEKILVLTLSAWAFSLMPGSTAIPLIFKSTAENGRILLLAPFLIPTGICFGIYWLLTMLGIALTDRIVFILLGCSPLLALLWCYVMYRISCRIFEKREL
jgi:hypothetical protein